ncbi:hypothetical protein WJX79_004056 [Trebouxia sp. C0005]
MACVSTKIILNNGVELPRIGIGTYRSTGASVTAAVICAWNSGIEHIDTASIYKNEEAIQRAVAAEGAFDVFITSKVSPYEQGTKRAMQACQKILEGLKTHSVDLVLIHWPGAAHHAYDSSAHAQLRLETWRVLEKFYIDGKFRAIGVSNFCERHLQDLLAHAKIRPMVNQIEVHPRYPQHQLRKLCKDNHIAVIAYSSLGIGDLLHHPNVLQVAKETHHSAAQVLLRWGLQQGCAVIPKSLNKQHIDEASPSKLLSWELNQQQMQALDSMEDGHKYCWDPSTVL